MIVNWFGTVEPRPWPAFWWRREPCPKPWCRAETGEPCVSFSDGGIYRHNRVLHKQHPGRYLLPEFGGRGSRVRWAGRERNDHLLRVVRSLTVPDR